ncbi:MAG: thermonuclease family protein [Marinobacterium sp.]|nr:thermonuclease family protein [Marinobacterium sp.]
MPFAHTRKAPFQGAFVFLASGVLFSAVFLFLLFILFLSLPAIAALPADCQPPGISQTVHVRTVFDGDTVLLKDGRRVRLLGINTPELGRKGRPDQPFAHAAGQLLERLIAGQSLRLTTGARRHNRYGRVLAHLQLPDGRLLSRQLLLQGLGWHVELAPVTGIERCLAAAEARARHTEEGLWSDNRGWRAVSTLREGDGGFMVLRGRVSLARHSGKTSWLELDQRLAVRISSTVVQQLSVSGIAGLQGKRVEVRGWVVDRQQRGRRLYAGYRRWLLSLQVPVMLRVLD